MCFEIITLNKWWKNESVQGEFKSIRHFILDEFTWINKTASTECQPLMLVRIGTHPLRNVIDKDDLCSLLYLQLCYANIFPYYKKSVKVLRKKGHSKGREVSSFLSNSIQALLS